MWGLSEARGIMSAHSRQAARPPAVCTLPGRLFGGATSRGIITARIQLLENGRQQETGVG